ncbi:MAG: M4 family metallopeptidase [Saprospiraceae bacterium]|nr:M4 family metallopeptidase [Saprospiraceae bacterium]
MSTNFQNFTSKSGLFVFMICLGMSLFASAQQKSGNENILKIKRNLDNLSTYALPESSLERLKFQYKVESADAAGVPTKFSCTHRDISEKTDITVLWAQRLPMLLGFHQKSGIGFVGSHKALDKMGNFHLKYNQLFGNYQVLGSQYFVHLYEANKVMAHGKILVPPSEILPLVKSEQLPDFIKKYFKENNKIFIQDPESAQALSIKEVVLNYWLNPEDSTWYLVYKTNILWNDLESWTLLIDSESGLVLKASAQHCGFLHGHEKPIVNKCNLYLESNERKHHCDAAALNESDAMFMGAETTTAADLNGVNQTMQVWRDGLDLYCIDGSKLMFQAGLFQLSNPVGAIWTVDAMNSGNPVPNQIKTRTNTWAQVAVSAHVHAGKVYDYFLNTFNRNSIDGLGGTIRSFVNFGTNYSGAFWSGGTIYYGNGNASKGYLQFAKGLDISAHEISHGVIDATAGLEYDAESGAINESFADIFATMVDRDDWTLGEDIIVPGHPIRPSGVERNMANPGQGLPKDSFRLAWQPMHVNQQYKGLNDGGGVHWNSGIPNHAYYLFVQGLMSQAGSEEAAKKIAEQVYYHALLYYVTRQSSFVELRSAIEQSCRDLYPSNVQVGQQASNAFESVGILTGAEVGGGVFDISETDLTANPGTEFVVCTRFNQNANRNEGVFLRNMSSQNLVQLSNQNIISKPTVTDNGSDIYFVATDFKVYKLSYNQSLGNYEQSILLNSPIYRNVSVSKDGRFLALLESPAQNNNQIKIKDLIAGTEKTFIISNPVLQTGISSSTVTQISSMDFDPSGRYLLYDGLSTYNIVNGTIFQQWDLGVLRFWDAANDQFGDGAIEKIFRAPLADVQNDVIYHFRNPVFAKNSPYVMAFDFYLGNFQNQKYINSDAIVAANVEKGELKYIQQSRAGLAYPSYSIKDDSLSFDDGFQIANRPSRIQTVGLSASKLDSLGTSLRLMSGYRWANRFGNGIRKLTNDIPKAVEDLFSTDEDQTLNGSVATNDIPGRDQPFTWKLLGVNGGAQYGMLNMGSDGSFSYVPFQNYHGQDAFSYEVCDADQECSNALVMLTIRSVNDVPLAIDDAASTKQNVNLTGNVALNDQQSGDGGNIWKLEIPNGGATGGSVNLDQNGQYLYTPNTNFWGSDQFAYSLCDADQDCSPAIVKITVEQIVGNNQVQANSEFKIFANPVKEKLILMMDEPLKEGLNCTIFDILGKNVSQKQFINGSAGLRFLEMNVSALKTGWYVVHVAGNNIQYVGKFVKK